MTASTERQDYRCGVCHMKNVCHCEHDTPYRDQLLQINDQTLPMHSRRTSQRAGSFNSKIPSNSTAHSHYQQGRDTQNTNSSYTKSHHSRYQQERAKQNNTNGSYVPPTHSIEANEQKKKNKSCVIL